MWQITYLSILVVAIAHQTVASYSNICSGLQPNSLVRNTQNCSSYYECSGGNATLKSCPVGQQFNHITRLCDHPNLVDCFACPQEEIFADVAVANECQQFVRCYNNRSEQMTCASGLAFDPELGKCNLASRVSCPFTVECPKNFNEAIFKRDRDNCTKYTVCVNGETHHDECPESLYFNPETLQCDLPENTKCEQPESEPLVCPRVGGPLFPHPTNCNWSYACSKDQIAIVYPCREGLFFDHKQQYCGARSFVQCAPGAH